MGIGIVLPPLAAMLLATAADLGAPAEAAPRTVTATEPGATTEPAPAPAEAPPPTAVEAEPVAAEVEPAPLPATPPAANAATPGPSGTDAVGSDEAPLPAAPPAPGGRLTRGVFTGRGWFELGVTIHRAIGLPADRQLLSAGLSGAFGLRPHRNFGVLTGATTWVGDIEEREGTDEDGNIVRLAASVATTAWDIVGVRGFLPLGKRLEPSVDLGTGVVFERRPFTGRRAWGGVHAALGLAVWIAPTISLRFAVDYRLLARADARRQYIGGTGMFSVHF